jgi:hypothetical protein
MDIKTKKGGLPPILNIQLDNTTKQNKGRYLIAYLAYLVQQGVIKEAYCNFLPVGHTHEDIDQFFSRVSVYTRHHNAPDPEALRQCIKRSYKKYGRSPIVVGWDKVANLSTYFAGYTSSAMSKDITLYYQLRVVMGRSGAIAGHPVMQARTWPGADADDKNDFWRGLLPDTSYVRIFNRKPMLYEDRYQLPCQAQPMHIGSDPASGERSAYKKALMVQRDSIERLMAFCGTGFTDTNKTNMRRLMDALGSNLDANRPVEFHWDVDDMECLYAQGQYVAHAPEPYVDEFVDANLFDDHHVLDSIQQERPDGLRDPAAFAQAVEDGLVNFQLMENVRTCVLVVGKFYLQRPQTLDRPFNLVKVVRVYKEEGSLLQWGAWVHPWEISTSGPNIDYFKDPWHASGAHKESQRYNPKVPMNQQSWTYPLCILSEFQDEVFMNKSWSKPRDFTKPLITAQGVKKQNLDQKKAFKVRNFTHRWNEDEAALGEQE